MAALVAQGDETMKMYDVYRECGTLELVAVLTARNLEEAKRKALKMGYGKECRIEESWEE